MRRIVFGKQAREEIESTVATAGDQFEVGGLLLGYRCFGRHIVVAVTVPEENSCRDKVQFYLNGSYHSYMARAVTEKTWPKPNILGIWHSHICDDIVFSRQDNLSNLQVAQILNGCISTLVALREDRLVWATYKINPDGRIKEIKTMLKGER